MSQCITSTPATLTVSAAQNEAPDSATGVSFYVKVNAATPSIVINFSGCDSIEVDPTPSTTPGTTSVTFTTADHNTEFSITFHDRSGSVLTHISEDPTTTPIFKPQPSC